MRRQKAEGTTRTTKYFDYTLLFLIIFMLGFGLVLLYSTSSYEAMNKFGDSTYYLRHQLRNMMLGLVLMVFFIVVDYRRWKRLALPIYGLSLLACVAVIFFGVEYNGSKRWLEIQGIQFQPSEIAKIAIILFMALIISRRPNCLGTFKNYCKMIAFAVPLGGIVAVSNLSTAIIIMGIAMIMLFVAGPKARYFIGLMVAGAFAVVALILAQGYRSSRIGAWLHPEDYDNGYQTLQGLYAIGSGGLFGKGLGESVQKLGGVPEAQNDMIFSIICEELGIFGAICIILLFVLMLWRFMFIANNAKDLFGSMIAVGVFAHIALQVILNIAVVTNTIPNTGIILPFISYGGTSLIFLMAEMGLVLNVSRSIRIEDR
ncbi:FtsW/RodA/SpoVE family cell cycle protein [Eubacterium oxidoreducens]|uniref:Probable peptidoglycan glycosyltransferase FtsW n=1 Tax=Eubacterium oxidoreducens TaxID=1732 RepID=A0A1G6AFZ7_EUBOX|nr:putative peptidoglycan glycosyltransferase FtsW [Eubacterium oxidoreducens]SDB07250.1 cell division protein FtsW [Eubacterium oxidoreducens]